MKFRIRFNRRHNIYITLFACAACLWMMVARFGLSVDRLISIALISLFFLIAIGGLAAIVGFILRYIQDKKD